MKKTFVNQVDDNNINQTNFKNCSLSSNENYSLKDIKDGANDISNNSDIVINDNNMDKDNNSELNNNFEKTEASVNCEDNCFQYENIVSLNLFYLKQFKRLKKLFKLTGKNIDIHKDINAMK